MNSTSSANTEGRAGGPAAADRSLAANASWVDALLREDAARDPPPGDDAVAFTRRVLAALPRPVQPAAPAGGLLSPWSLNLAGLVAASALWPGLLSGQAGGGTSSLAAVPDVASWVAFAVVLGLVGWTSWRLALDALGQDAG